MSVIKMIIISVCLSGWTVVFPAVTFLLPDGGVLAVGQRAGRAVTQPRDVVLIPTEVLTLCPGGEKMIQKVHVSSYNEDQKICI